MRDRGQGGREKGRKGRELKKRDGEGGREQKRRGVGRGGGKGDYRIWAGGGERKETVYFGVHYRMRVVWD